MQVHEYIICMCVCVYIYIYIYTHTHTRMEQEQEQLKHELQSLHLGRSSDTDDQVGALAAKIDRLIQANVSSDSNNKNMEAGPAGAVMQSQSQSRDWMPLMEEEEELRKLEMMPQDTQLSKLRKAHLQEMIKMK
jgi:hypothetical protein